MARADVERQTDAEVSRLRQLADNAAIDRVEMLQSVESQVVHLAIAVASRIVQREVSPGRERGPAHRARRPSDGG